MEARVELGVGDLLLAEVLLEHRVVRLGRGLEQLVAAQGHLVGHLGRDGDLDLLAALEAVRLAVDEVHVAAERVRRADREVERARPCCRRRARSSSSARSRVRVLAVALVEDEAGRGVRGPPDLDRRLQAGLDPARRVHDEQRRVGGVEALDHLGHEVRVAGRVDDRDLVLAVLERADGEAQRAVLLLLLGLVVEVRGAVVDPAQPRDRAGAEQHLLRQRRLAAAGMAGEHDAPDVGEVVALQRHRARFLSVGGRPAGFPAAGGTVAQGGRLAMRDPSGTVGARAPNDAPVGPMIVGILPPDVRTFQVVHDQAPEGRQRLQAQRHVHQGRARDRGRRARRRR